MKICTGCKIEKLPNEFGKSNKTKDGLYYLCKSCKKSKSKRYYELNSQFIKSKVEKYRNNNLEKVKDMVKKYQLKNEDKIKEYKTLYYIENSEYYSIKGKERYLNNKNNTTFKEKRNNYQKERRKNPLFRFKEGISRLIHFTLKSRGYKKRYKSEEILGCTIVDFKNYIESKFTEGMSWDNYGKWHLDHVTPISYATDENETIKLNHYSNYQPMWMMDNLKKGNRWVG